MCGDVGWKKINTASHFYSGSKVQEKWGSEKNRFLEVEKISGYLVTMEIIANVYWTLRRERVPRGLPGISSQQ